MSKFLGSRPDLFFAGASAADDHDSCFEFGPLSRIIVNSQRAVLVRVIPKFAERTDLQLIEFVAGDAPAEAPSPAANDAVADELRRTARRRPE